MKVRRPHFLNETKAREYIEALRWPDGRVCHHCGSIGSEYPTKREGRFRCGAKECRKDFTVTTGTVMEASHVKLTVWLMAFYLMAASKKGMSAHQLHRSLDVTYKTAWFLCHRIRAAMATGGLISPIGGAGQVVEADETYFGMVANPTTRKARGGKFLKTKHGAGPANKRAIVALVERGGKGRMFHVAIADKATVQKIVRENVHPESRLHTDESSLYRGSPVSKHETVKHSAGEYVREDVTTNSAEGFFGVFKKGMTGVYQHCAEKHLHRYLSEFEFRYNNRIKLGVDDAMRAALAVKGADGKRLTYRRTNSA